MICFFTGVALPCCRVRDLIAVINWKIAYEKIIFDFSSGLWCNDFAGGGAGAGHSAGGWRQGEVELFSGRGVAFLYFLPGNWYLWIEFEFDRHL